MELLLTKEDIKRLATVQAIIDDWRETLNVDPIWCIHVDVLPADQISNAVAKIDLRAGAHYHAKFILNYDVFSSDEDMFEEEIHKAVAHELLHIITEDFMRTAIVAAGKNKELIQELRHKYEQFISRLHISILPLVLEEG